MGLRITILDPITQDTLINISTSQFGPFFHLMNHVVEAMVAMTLDPRVNPKTNINIGEPQASESSTLIHEATTRLAQRDSNFDHTTIGQIL